MPWRGDGYMIEQPSIRIPSLDCFHRLFSWYFNTGLMVVSWLMNVNDIELWIMKYYEWDEKGWLVGRILVWGEYCVTDRDLSISNGEFISSNGDAAWDRLSVGHGSCVRLYSLW